MSQPSTQNISPTSAKPARTKMESRADVTDAAARAILHSELAAREAKTARLRAARMAREAKKEAPAAKPARAAKRS